MKLEKGDKLTKQVFDLSDKTFNRYMRLAKQYGMLTEKDYNPSYRCTSEEVGYVPVAVEDGLVKDKHVKVNVQKGVERTLIFDIETFPLIVYAWGLFKQNISIGQIIEDNAMITWSAKWLGEDRVMRGVITPEEAIMRDDKRITSELWKLIDEADILVAHYGDNFDIPMMKGRFLKHGLGLPSPYRSVDTKKIASREFRLTSNKLDAVATYLGCENKIKTDFELWKDCSNGDQDAIKRMADYNDQDVLTLEEVYLKLRGYDSKHPSVNVVNDTDKPSCRVCNSDKLEPYGFKYTGSSKFQVYKCKKCGALSRGRKSEFNKDDRQNKLMGV